ncbi:MAG: universal stress protein [Sulfurisoma sp.]|nr:universal stress protein [Sulfurisoma sp.]
MIKVLIPVDGSPASLRAVDHVIKLAQGCGDKLELRLVNVQPPVDAWEVKRFLPESEVQAMQESRGGDALAAARQKLDAAGVAYTPVVLLGAVAETLVAHAREQDCDSIVMGTRGESAIHELLVGSVTHEVIRLGELPVTLVK